MAPAGSALASPAIASILHDTIDHGCDDATHPTGCTLHYILSTNNVLSANSGVLYLTIELGFNSSTSPIDIGGVRLTLEYDE